MNSYFFAHGLISRYGNEINNVINRATARKIINGCCHSLENRTYGFSMRKPSEPAYRQCFRFRGWEISEHWLFRQLDFQVPFLTQQIQQ